jgi:hypothetical protein
MASLADLQFLEGAPALVPDEISPLLGRMRRMLLAVRPRSDAEALKLLRTRFPESTLSERLHALSSLRRY